MQKVNAKDFLGKDVSIEIDRPLGTRYPKHGFMYMLNYGFIPNTISGKVIAIIHRTNDDMIN